MPTSRTASSYRWMAGYYDQLFQPAFAALRRARQEILRDIVPGVSSMCDLGAGTGTTALDFARKGIAAFAVDLSSAMCRQARAKARLSGLPLHVIEADMRDFRLPQSVDLVICEGDALNHIPKASGLGRVARCVFRALRPGGWFYFDVNNAAGFKRYWKGTVRIENPALVMFMSNAHGPDGSRASSDIEYFIREDRMWRRHRERVEEVSWTAAEIRRVLKQAGFASVRAWDASRFFGPASGITSGCRTIYLARKADARSTH